MERSPKFFVGQEVVKLREGELNSNRYRVCQVGAKDGGYWYGLIQSVSHVGLESMRCPLPPMEELLIGDATRGTGDPPVKAVAREDELLAATDIPWKLREQISKWYEYPLNPPAFAIGDRVLYSRGEASVLCTVTGYSLQLAPEAEPQRLTYVYDLLREYETLEPLEIVARESHLAPYKPPKPPELTPEETIEQLKEQLIKATDELRYFREREQRLAGYARGVLGIPELPQKEE